jgi:hypothetical protein
VSKHDNGKMSVSIEIIFEDAMDCDDVKDEKVDDENVDEKVGEILNVDLTDLDSDLEMEGPSYTSSSSSSSSTLTSFTGSSIGPWSTSDSERCSDSEDERELVCFMCGTTEGVTELKDIPPEWGTMDTFCKPCVDKFDRYVVSKRTDLTHGCPDIYSHDPFERYTRDVSDDEEEEILQCGYCGKEGDGVVRNYGMYNKYKLRDFCKNATCCKYYTEFQDLAKYMKGKKHLTKPHSLSDYDFSKMKDDWPFYHD